MMFRAFVRFRTRQHVLLGAIAIAILLVGSHPYPAAFAGLHQATETVHDVDPRRARFNPNYVIADPIFTNSTSMSDNDIQRFFETHDSYLTDYKRAGKPASTMIGEAARRYEINPKVLLVMLQMKSGLVSSHSTSNPPPDEVLDFAMGIGCDETSECDSKYAGLDIQIEQLAHRYRLLFEGGYLDKSSWISPGDPIQVDDTTVWPASIGTLILYLDLQGLGTLQDTASRVRRFWTLWTEAYTLGDIHGYTLLDTINDLKYPFGSNQTWYVFQGYDTGTHTGVYRFAFDLVKNTCCNRDTSASLIAAATGSFYGEYPIYDSATGAYLGQGTKITLADGYIVEYDHLMNVADIQTGSTINYGDSIADVWNGHPGGLNHLHFQLLYNGQPKPLNFGVWDYSDGGPSNNCGCGAHGEWGGTRIDSGSACCLCASLNLANQSQAGDGPQIVPLSTIELPRFTSDFTAIPTSAATSTTSSPTPPATRTPTGTPTKTPTLTSTPTPTSTSTAMPTSTHSPTSTSTPTAQPTSTPTWTPTLIPDTTPPHGSLAINDGAGEARSLNISLQLQAEDEGRGVTEMRFSRDGVEWSDWESYQQLKLWHFSGENGPRTVHVQFRDAAGNVSEPTSATINVNLTEEKPSSESFRILSSVMGIGGGEKSSSNYRVQSTTGQPSSPAWSSEFPQSSESFQVMSGYWGQQSASAPCVLTGDIDGDQDVDVDDLTSLAGKWRMTSDHPDWQDKYDFDGDKEVTVIDLLTLQGHWNDTCP